MCEKLWNMTPLGLADLDRAKYRLGIGLRLTFGVDVDAVTMGDEIICLLRRLYTSIEQRTNDLHLLQRTQHTLHN